MPGPEAEEERESIAFDSGQCARSMMLAAWELGIGALIVMRRLPGIGLENPGGGASSDSSEAFVRAASA